MNLEIKLPAQNLPGFMCKFCGEIQRNRDHYLRVHMQKLCKAACRVSFYDDFDVSTFSKSEWFLPGLAEFQFQQILNRNFKKQKEDNLAKDISLGNRLRDRKSRKKRRLSPLLEPPHDPRELDQVDFETLIKEYFEVCDEGKIKRPTVFKRRGLRSLPRQWQAVLAEEKAERVRLEKFKKFYPFSKFSPPIPIAQRIPPTEGSSKVRIHSRTVLTKKGTPARLPTLLMHGGKTVRILKRGEEYIKIGGYPETISSPPSEFHFEQRYFQMGQTEMDSFKMNWRVSDFVPLIPEHIWNAVKFNCRAETPDEILEGPGKDSDSGLLLLNRDNSRPISVGKWDQIVPTVAGADGSKKRFISGVDCSMPVLKREGEAEVTFESGPVQNRKLQFLSKIKPVGDSVFRRKYCNDFSKRYFDMKTKDNEESGKSLKHPDSSTEEEEEVSDTSRQESRDNSGDEDSDDRQMAASATCVVKLSSGLDEKLHRIIHRNSIPDRRSRGVKTVGSSSG